MKYRGCHIRIDKLGRYRTSIYGGANNPNPSAKTIAELHVKIDAELEVVRERTLIQCERVIESVIEESNANVGKELAIIRDQRLYKAGYKSFDQYLKERWGFTRQYASKVIRAWQGKVSEPKKLSTTVDTSGGERSDEGGAVQSNAGDVGSSAVTDTPNEKTEEAEKRPEEVKQLLSAPAPSVAPVTETAETPLSGLVGLVLKRLETEDEKRAIQDLAPLVKWYLSRCSIMDENLTSDATPETEPMKEAA